MPVKLTNVYVKSWTINGSADGDTFDFNFTNGEEDPQPAGMLLPAVQAAREAARSSTAEGETVEDFTFGYEKVEWEWDTSDPGGVDDFMF